MHGVADDGAQYRPQLEKPVLVEVAGQVVVQALVQDGLSALTLWASARRTVGR